MFSRVWSFPYKFTWAAISIKISILFFHEQWIVQHWLFFPQNKIVEMLNNIKKRKSMFNNWTVGYKNMKLQVGNYY